jgi:steroid 5-alpha reductase family enzyme
VIGAAAGCTIAFVLLWWRQTRTRDATSVDAAWAIAIGVLALVAAAGGDGHWLQRLLAALLGGGWSARLAWHLLAHRVRGHRGEDGRYRALREHWGHAAHGRWLLLYLAQAGTALVFALPFRLLAQHDAPALAAAQVAGLLVVVAAQLLEGLADRQLEAHRRDPAQRGRTCRAGLWRYSRHPNYFFEWLTWCGIALVAAPAAGWLAAVQPALMLALVRFVSGVPFTELQALRSRGDDYRRYQAETNAFVPWWPRSGSRA